MVNPIYGLYHDRKQAILKIEPFNSYLKLDGLENDGVARWNDYYYISNSRKALRDKAKEIKKEWIIETQLRLDLLKELPVIHKY